MLQTGFYIDQPSGFVVAENQSYYAVGNYKLKAFRLKNFKAFRDTGWIELNRLTLLFGHNSSGKSALYQILQMVLYTYMYLMREERFADFSYMEHVMGKFDDLCNKMTENPAVAFGFLFEDEKNSAEYWISMMRDHSKDTGYVADVRGQRGDCSYNLLKYYDSLNIFFLERKMDVIIPQEVEILAEELLAAMRAFARSLQIMSAHRYRPDRVMEMTGTEPRDLGSTGKNTYQLLYALSEIQGKKVPLLEKWLEKFGYTYRWRMKGVNRGEFLLKDMKSGIELNLLDHGFGISQSLPLAVALDRMDGQTILIDSPEAFLQTSMQSEMGDLMIEGSKNGRILLETGSEYLILRIRRRVAEGLIAREDISVYYLDETGMGETECHKLALDEYGEFQNPPDSFVRFFSSDFKDIEKMDEIRRKKRCRKGLL